MHTLMRNKKMILLFVFSHKFLFTHDMRKEMERNLLIVYFSRTYNLRNDNIK